MSNPQTALQYPLHFIPVYKERVWGGQQLQPDGDGAPIGEAWILHEDQAVAAGPLWGMTLAELTRDHPQELLGKGRYHQRFPLLLKLLDCQDWLSVQVHPDDALARELVGPGELGKTEAWHVLKAAPHAKLISGTKNGVTLDEVQQAILAEDVSHLTQEREVHASETLMVPAGTLHALGPGLLIFEIQQTSDTTYRVYDWDRPASAGRELHLTQSAKAVKVGQAGFTPAPQLAAGEMKTLAECEYFRLEALKGGPAHPLAGDTAGGTFHALTVKEGEMTLKTAAGPLQLKPLDTVLLPAALGRYTLSGNFVALRSSLP